MGKDKLSMGPSEVHKGRVHKGTLGSEGRLGCHLADRTFTCNIHLEGQEHNTFIDNMR